MSSSLGINGVKELHSTPGRGNKDLVKRILGTPSPQFAPSTLLSDTLERERGCALRAPHPHTLDRALDTRELLKRVKCGSETNRKSIYCLPDGTYRNGVYTSLPLFPLQQIEVTLYPLHGGHLMSLCFDRLCLSVYIRSWYMLLLHLFFFFFNL